MILLKQRKFFLIFWLIIDGFATREIPWHYWNNSSVGSGRDNCPDWDIGLLGVEVQKILASISEEIRRTLT